MRSPLSIALAVLFAAPGPAVAQEDWALPAGTPSSSAAPQQGPPDAASSAAPQQGPPGAPSSSAAPQEGPPGAPSPGAAPREGWDLPGFPDRSQQPSSLPDPADLPPPPLGLPPEPEERPWTPPPPPPPLKSFSLLGGRTLGAGRSAVALTAGFPYAQLRYARGFLPRLDAGVSVRTFYGLMTEGSLEVRWEFQRWGPISLALNGSAGGAFFLRPARTETQWGARWVTGRRHLNAEAGGAISLVPDDGRGLHPFLEVRYLMALDLEPTQTDPLGGTPPPVEVGNNTLFKLGAEVPLGERWNLLLALGMDLHGRREDSRVFFNFALGMAGSF